MEKGKIKRLLVVLIAFVLLASAILIAIPTSAAEDFPEIPECEMIDVGPRLRNSVVPVDLSNVPTENECCEELEERIEILEEKIAALEPCIRWTQRKLIEED